MSKMTAADQQKVIDLWALIFKASNECLRQASVYGFDAMHEASPNITEIVEGLIIFEAVFGALLQNPSLDWEHERSLLNAKEQLSRMRRLAGALTAGDRDTFDETAKLIEKQLAI